MTVSAEPPPLAALEALDPADARAALTGVDLLVLGSAEAFALVEDEVETAADSRPQGTAALLARTVPEVVVTGGAAGAWWHGRRGEPVHVPAEPVAEVGPWAGAGREGVRPAFVAGLLAAWLLDAPPAQALRSGARVAAQALAGACPLP
jgi:sugar/nucleoside kinase (ribokinase family)